MGCSQGEVSFVRVIMRRVVRTLLTLSGCTPRGWGSGAAGRGTKGRGLVFMVNLTMSTLYGIMKVRDFRIT